MATTQNRDELSRYVDMEIALSTPEYRSALYCRLIEVGNNYVVVERLDGTGRKISVHKSRIMQIAEKYPDYNPPRGER